jgi:hypothetical protein
MIEHVAELGNGDRDQAVAPKNPQQVTAPPPQNIKIAYTRVLLQSLLHLQRWAAYTQRMSATLVASHTQTPSGASLPHSTTGDARAR